MQNTIPFEQRNVGLGESTTKDTRALNPHVNSHGKITLYIKTREVVTSSRLVEIPVLDSFASGNVAAMSSRRIVTRERVLDQEQEEAFKNCRELANDLGIELEVKDLSRQGFRTRISAFLFGKKVSGKTPSVAFDGGAMITLVSASYRNESHVIVSPPFLETRPC